jgi:hypothetical protein
MGGITMKKAKLTVTTAFLAILLMGPYQTGATAKVSEIAELKIAVAQLKLQVAGLLIKLAATKHAIGFDEVCLGSQGSVPIYTVPTGKTFILTDVEITSTLGVGSILRQTGSTPKTIIQPQSSSLYTSHFNSGYEFPGGSQVLYQTTGSGCAYISGYLTWS